jgi:hypothetical protein
MTDQSAKSPCGAAPLAPPARLDLRRPAARGAVPAERVCG